MSTPQAKISPLELGYLPGRRRTNWKALAGVIFLVGVGFIISMGISGLLEGRFELGLVAVLAAFVLFPVGLLIGVRLIPRIFRKLASVKLQLRWWHWLWFLAYLSSLVFAHSEDSASAMPSGATIATRLLPEVIILAVLLFQLTRRGGWMRDLWRGLTAVLTVYALICAASALWSVFPTWTLFKSLEYLLDVSVLAAALANIHTLEDYGSLFNWVFTICGLELVWICLQFPLWPNESFFEDYRLRGAWPLTSYNQVGQAGALLAIIALCRLFPISGRKSDRGFYGALFAFGVATMLLSQTRSAMGGLAVAVTLVLLFSRPWLAMGIGGLSAAVWAFSRVSGVLVTFLERGQSEKSLYEFTGREYFWSYAWQLFSEHPIRGLGAYAAGRFIVQAKLHIFTATLHSDWVELLVGIGIMGLLPLAVALLGTWWFLLAGVRDRTLDPQQRQLALEAIGVLTIITIHSFFNDELIWHAPLYFLVVLGYAELMRRHRKLAHSPQLAFAGIRRMSPSAV